jgi:hypothetical protein
VIGTLVVLGGVASLCASVYYTAATYYYSQTVTAADTFNPSDDRAGKNAQKMQYVYGGVGGGLVVVGVVLHAIGAWQRDSQTSHVSLVPQIDSHGAMLAATGSF